MSKFNYNVITVSNSKLKKTDENNQNKSLTYGLSLSAGYVRYMDKHGEKQIRTTCVNFKYCLQYCNSKVGFFQSRDNVKSSRIKRTIMFFENKDLFMSLLDSDLYQLTLESELLGKKAYFRLNVASDIHFEIYQDLICKYDQIRFYDYTKSLVRCEHLNLLHNQGKLLNYKLGYSCTNQELLSWSFDQHDYSPVIILPYTGKEKNFTFPKYFIANNGDKIQIVDGDINDHRGWNEDSNSLVCLRFKGKYEDLKKLIKENNPYIASDQVLKRMLTSVKV